MPKCVKCQTTKSVSSRTAIYLCLKHLAPDRAGAQMIEMDRYYFSKIIRARAFIYLC